MPESNLIYTSSRRPACGGPRVGRSLAALRLFGRSRPAAPTRFDPQAVIANTVTMSLHEM
ncbi:hypothetical protein [Nonomuraea sp. NPDC003754]